ncbi:thymidylate synthase [Enterobacter hormaechei subsp. xiangfangensis]
MVRQKCSGIRRSYLGYSNGYLGPVYGRQWRDFQGVDQIQQLIKDINKSKESGIHNRRLLVSAWNPPELDKMALPPCHYAFQLLILPIP